MSSASSRSAACRSRQPLGEQVAAATFSTNTEARLAELNIVIPTHNRAEQLRTCLQGLKHQTEAFDNFEVTVVVDGSTDGTKELLSSFLTPFRINVLYQAQSGQHIARNRGVAASSSQYCLFLDDDIEPCPELVAVHLRLLRSRPDAVGLGAMPMSIRPDSDWFVRSYAKQWDERYARRVAGHRPPKWVDCYGGNLSLSRAAFEQVGGFAPDTPASHDIELGYRLQQHGLSFVYLADAVGVHAEQKNGKKLTAMLVRHGRAAVELYQRHPPVLPELLGTFRHANLRTSIFRRVLLFLRTPPRLLFGLGLLAGPVRHSWSRFLTDYCFWYGVRSVIRDSDLWRRLLQATPILLYHAFGTNKEQSSRFVMPISRFNRQMAWLKLAGYNILPLEELVRCRREFRLPPRRSVVITMDDGYADNVQLALPILRRYRFTATVFVVSGRVGGTSDWASSSEARGRPLASWSDLRHLAQMGHSIGAHSRSHAALPSLPESLLREEIEGSRDDLQRGLGQPVHVFAYPFGAHNQQVRAVAEAAGFLGSCGVGDRLNDSTNRVQALDRVEIRGSDRLPVFVLRMIMGRPNLLRRQEAQATGGSATIQAGARS